MKVYDLELVAKIAAILQSKEGTGPRAAARMALHLIDHCDLQLEERRQEAERQIKPLVVKPVNR